MTDTTRKPRTRRDFLRMAALLPAALLTAGTALAFPQPGEFSTNNEPSPGGPTRKKVARKKATRKKATRKKTARKKATRKKATRKKTVRKKTARKKASRKKASRRSYSDFTDAGFGNDNYYPQQPSPTAGFERSTSGYGNFESIENFTSTPTEVPSEAELPREIGRWIKYGED